MTALSGEARIAIAVLTYRRNELLAKLLRELVVQADTVHPRATIIVVDNDPYGGAQAPASEWATDVVRYVHEPRPGIAAARNRALAEAADHDALVFIDDDELPSPRWLTTLVGAWREWNCAAVAGPVLSTFTADIDPWVAATGVFQRRRPPSGTSVNGAGAGNLLLDLAQVRSRDLSFDERLGLTGGEDTMFTHRLVNLGGEIRWSDEAEVTELIPIGRTSRRWVLQRFFRSGSSWSRAEVFTAGTRVAQWRRRITLTAKAAVRVCAAVLAYLWHLAGGDLTGQARAARALSSQAGVVVGSLGYVYAEYARAEPPSPLASTRQPQSRQAQRAQSG